MYYWNLLTGVCVILSALILSVFASKNSVPEKSFPEVMVVKGRAITCNGKSTGKRYASPIYTCENITVDGKLLRHGYMDPSNDNMDSAAICVNCICGQVRDEPNDVYQLCKEMLASSNLGRGEYLSSVHIPHPICKQKGPEERVKYITPLNSAPYWADTFSEHGYIYTLHCITS